MFDSSGRIDISGSILVKRLRVVDEEAKPSEHDYFFLIIKQVFYIVS